MRCCGAAGGFGRSCIEQHFYCGNDSSAGENGISGERHRQTLQFEPESATCPQAQSQINQVGTTLSP
jgi:hypothetical protein